MLPPIFKNQKQQMPGQQGSKLPGPQKQGVPQQKPMPQMPVRQAPQPGMGGTPMPSKLPAPMGGLPGPTGKPAQAPQQGAGQPNVGQPKQAGGNYTGQVIGLLGKLIDKGLLVR